MGKKKKKKNEEKNMSIIKIWRLKSVARQLSDRPKIFAGQNENLSVLSNSPAVFAKIENTLFYSSFFVYFQLPTIGAKRRKRQYDVSLIGKAYQDVMQKGYSVYKAARLYGIPESTLRDTCRTLGLQPVEDDVLPTPGPGTTLSREEERMLTGHMEYMNSIGYGYSRQEFLNLATDFAVSLKKKSPEDPSFTQAWFDGLKGRWPGITLAKPQKLSVVRAKSASQPIIEKYYAELS